MRKFFLPALLCLLFSFTLPAQELQQGILYDSVLIPSRDGALITAIFARSQQQTAPQAAILQFTIYARRTDFKHITESVNRGYIGVMAYSRGKWNSPGDPMPYEYDAIDVYEVIDWIAHQPWSNQQVAMWGGSYNGFTQWAATKKLHPALKTIVPAASVAPGLDVPMTNNVFMSFVFPWTYYLSNNKFLDNTDYLKTKWNDLYLRWYDTGSTYRALDTLMGRPGNRIWQRWLDHPSYDQYWQQMIPYKNDFSTINIPVLSISGYYDGGQIGATYYLREHLKYNPQAEHYFLIGPYGHYGCQGFPDSVYNGYRIDPVARIPIHEIIYQWFDHVLKGAPKPSILQNKINFQVMGTNQWKHVPSLQQMSNDTLTFYLQTPLRNDQYTLSAKKPGKKDHIDFRVDFTDRQSMNSYFFFSNIIYDSLRTNNGLLFMSEPLKEPLEINGCFSGVLKGKINKKDLDCSVNLFELMPDGRYFHLSYFMGRASYAGHPEKRVLLQPGTMASIPFTNTYMTAKKLSKGSRIVILLNVNKSGFEQINYGSGKEVNEETIRDAGEPLNVQWYNDSYIRIPVFRLP